MKSYPSSLEEQMWDTGIDVLNYGAGQTIKMAGNMAKRKFDDYISDAVPGSTSNTTSKEPVITTDHKKKYPKIQIKNIKRRPDQSGIIQNHHFYDSHLLETLGENSLTRLNVSCGKPVYPDHIKTYLKQLMGSAVSRTSFAGRMLSGQGGRVYHHQAFRHNISLDVQAPFGQPYPPTMINNILSPENSAPFVPKGPGSAAGTPVLPAGTTSFRDMTDSEIYWSPDNLSDLEDMSWNLNRFKVFPITNTVGAPTKFNNDAPLFVPGSHARKSMIYEQNLVDYSSTGAGIAAGYNWKACINRGVVEYDFMNKGLGGAKVIVVVNKVKKTHVLASQISEYEVVPSFPMNKHIDAIQKGWLNTMGALASTDRYDGREIAGNDVTANPAFPFLPTLKKTRQSECDFLEVSRQTFAMPSGSRRNVTIKLPGAVYSPNNIPQLSDVPLQVPCMSEHTYVITIATCGTPSTTTIADSDGTYRVGDDYNPSNIQFYATYSEYLGPAVFDPPQNPTLYNNGGIIAQGPLPLAFNTLGTATMLSQSAGVRIPPSDSITFTNPPGTFGTDGFISSAGAQDMSNRAN